MALISFPADTKRVFVYGLLLRIAAVLLLAPTIQEQWFVGFITSTLASPSLDPWSVHVNAGGDLLAFPYGPVMYLTLVPLTGVGALIDLAAGSGMTFAGLGFRLTLLAVDVVLLLMLRRLSKHDHQLVTLYWLSPISIFVTYWHGQLDLIPIVFFVAALFLVRAGRPAAGGLAMGLSIATKLSTALVAPFVVIFLFRSNRFAGARWRFVGALLLALAAIQGPFLVSGGVRAMMVGSPLYQRVFDIAIPISHDLVIFVFPIVYLVLIGFSWHLGRMTQDLLNAFLASAFLSIVLLSDAPPGWYLWSVPFLALCGARASWRTRLMLWAFSTIFVIVDLPLVSGAELAFTGARIAPPIDALFARFAVDLDFYASFGKTLLLAGGLSVAFWIMRRALEENEFYQLSRRPLAIGIAGDSGVGKSTLGEALAGLFGAGSVAAISGDDYHRYDRKGPLWQHLTHLDPRANDLNAMSDDALSLLAGREIYSRHYDHATGRFTTLRRVKPSDVVLVNGLHALVPHLLRERFDLKIFVEMDEELRCYFKIARDTTDRGSAGADVIGSIERRRPDYEKYLRPQAGLADIIFRLMPATEHWRETADRAGSCPLRLKVAIRRAIQYELLVRALIAIAGLRVDVLPTDDYAFNVLMIDAVELTAEDTAELARRLAPELSELLALEPTWKGGVSGAMQLIVILELAQIRATRGRRR